MLWFYQTTEFVSHGLCRKVNNFIFTFSAILCYLLMYTSYSYNKHMHSIYSYWMPLSSHFNVSIFISQYFLGEGGIELIFLLANHTHTHTIQIWANNFLCFFHSVNQMILIKLHIHIAREQERERVRDELNNIPNKDEVFSLHR